MASVFPALSQAINNVGLGKSIDFDSNDDRVNLGPILNNLTLFPYHYGLGQAKSSNNHKPFFFKW
jgi:hypothetical protein